MQQPPHRGRVPGKLRGRPVLVDVFVGDQRRVAVDAAVRARHDPARTRRAEHGFDRPAGSRSAPAEGGAPRRSTPGSPARVGRAASPARPRARARSCRPWTAPRRAGDSSRSISISSRTDATMRVEASSGPRRIGLSDSPCPGRSTRHDAIARRGERREPLAPHVDRRAPAVHEQHWRGVRRSRTPRRESPRRPSSVTCATRMSGRRPRERSPRRRWEPAAGAGGRAACAGVRRSRWGARRDAR